MHAAEMPLVLMVRKERDSSVRRPSLSMSAAHLQRSCPGAIHAEVTGDISTHGRVHIKMASFAHSDIYQIGAARARACGGGSAAAAAAAAAARAELVAGAVPQGEPPAGGAGGRGGGSGAMADAVLPN